MFPLCDFEGQCWGAIVAYNYSRIGEWSVKDFNACESVCNTLVSKLNMLSTLKDGARKVKLLNVQGQLLDLMQSYTGVEVLRGLVSGSSASLMSIIPQTQVGRISTRPTRISALRASLLA